MNAPFQHFDYQNINEEMQNLLSTLQQKLSRIELMNVCTPKMRSACAAISQFFNFDQTEKDTSSNPLKQKKNENLVQHVFRVIITALIQKKTFFEKNFFSIIEMIKTLQLKNEFITTHKSKIETSRNQISDLSSSWRFDNDVLKFKKKIYISENQTVCAEFLKCYHDDELTKYFNINKINELLNHKY